MVIQVRLVLTLYDIAPLTLGNCTSSCFRVEARTRVAPQTPCCGWPGYKGRGVEITLVPHALEGSTWSRQRESPLDFVGSGLGVSVEFYDARW